MTRQPTRLAPRWRNAITAVSCLTTLAGVALLCVWAWTWTWQWAAAALLLFAAGLATAVLAMAEEDDGAE
ncbi:MAG: hypothetical protein IRZ07_30845 [Microbispora sp.]|nr:hypothetical protein [Microbispora sp.]